MTGATGFQPYVWQPQLVGFENNFRRIREESYHSKKLC